MAWFVVRPYDCRRFDELLAVERDCFDMPWARVEYEELLNRGGGVYLLLDPAGDVVGYYAVERFRLACQIMSIAVIPELRRLGYASLMLAHQIRTMQHSRRRLLMVLLDDYECAMSKTLLAYGGWQVRRIEVEEVHGNGKSNTMEIYKFTMNIWHPRNRIAGYMKQPWNQ